MILKWIENKEKNKLMDELSTFIDNLMGERDSLAEKLRNFKKDEEISKLLKENESLRINSLHTLSEKEREEADAFREEHWKKCKGNTSFLLTGASIGTRVEVICSKCKTQKDITDISVW
ncbi:hypothetical protein AB684_10960 [Bacillus licheniformis]|uniref:hypothetical protein n=1 Tax=Bacillus TaxID=1386 RepID=UPI0003129EFB|nr:hypothetical protein [Bacillus licheniformis]AMR10677.1 hypothetical protein AB684_10960 [Bacillus licheniformis]KJH58798.1 hypothetical protein UF14_10390 [Bacillus licheniformis]KYC83610.1 hypothetical protein B4091_2188 [Bacillus licheniformis]MCM3374085.1 hypothetical protein [Bacillus licheniformis]MCM3433506.1 hypothetical protein [Bacillus licheniformis]